MRILLTGAAGFIGSHLGRALVWRGDDVIGIDNLHYYYSYQCKVFNVDLINLTAKNEPSFFPSEDLAGSYEKLRSYYDKPVVKTGQFSFFEGDITDYVFLNKIFEKYQFDAVVHLAAMAGVPFSTNDPITYTRVNVMGTANLLELCQKRGIKKFVFGSSSSVYGNREDAKAKESDAISSPSSVYGASKAAGEALCHSFHSLFGINISIARIFGPIYGPFQRPYGMLHQRVINYNHNNREILIFGKDGLDTAKDSTYIDDTVQGILLCLDKDIKFDVFNIGTSDPKPIRLWLELIEEEMKKKVLYRKIDVDRADVVSSADLSKSREILGYNPKIDVITGIKRQVEIFNETPPWYKRMKNI